MARRSFLFVAAAAFALAATGCSDAVDVISAPSTKQVAAKSHLGAPGALVSVSTEIGTIQIWPFTGSDFSATPVDQDPINLIFTGEADPRALRAALIALDGDRTAFGFPAEFPFNCEWTDAIGGVQAAYAEASGWVGSAIQLECGPYGPIRFHLRLFGAGDFTLANAHFEILIPGTTTHQVLSWTLAQQLVVVDFIRTGLLGAAPAPSGLLHPVPTFREIPAIIYNALPAELRAIAGGPAGDVMSPVGIPNSGVAILLHMAGSAPIVPEVKDIRTTVMLDQTLPRPFCSAGPTDWVSVSGPVDFRHQVVVTASGNYISQVMARGTIDVTPMNVLVSPPVPAGPTIRAQVSEHYQGRINDNVSYASMLRQQTIFPQNRPGGGALKEWFTIGPGNSSRHDLQVRCGG